MNPQSYKGAPAEPSGYKLKMPLLTVTTLANQLNKVFGRPLAAPAGQEPVLGDVYEALVYSTENTSSTFRPHFRLDMDDDELFVLLDDDLGLREPNLNTFGDLAQCKINLGKSCTYLGVPLLDAESRPWTIHVRISRDEFWSFQILRVEMPTDTLNSFKTIYTSSIQYQELNGGEIWDAWECGEKPRNLLRLLGSRGDVR